MPTRVAVILPAKHDSDPIVVTVHNPARHTVAPTGSFDGDGPLHLEGRSDRDAVLL